MYSIAEVAREFRVSEKTVRNWIAAGRVVAFRVGGTWRIEADEVSRMKSGGAAYDTKRTCGLNQKQR